MQRYKLAVLLTLISSPAAYAGGLEAEAHCQKFSRVGSPAFRSCVVGYQGDDNAKKAYGLKYGSNSVSTASGNKKSLDEKLCDKFVADGRYTNPQECHENIKLKRETKAKEAQREIEAGYHDKCISYGLKKGTTPYADCMIKLELQQHEKQAINRREINRISNEAYHGQQYQRQTNTLSNDPIFRALSRNATAVTPWADNQGFGGYLSEELGHKPRSQSGNCHVTPHGTNMFSYTCR